MSEAEQQAPTNHDEQVDSDERPLLEHLIELRNRLLRCVLIIGIVFFPLYFVANDIYTFVAAPLMAQLPQGATMIATEVASPFFTPFKLAAYCSVFATMPFTLHQMWAFIAPGLYLTEKKFALPLLVSSTVLFYTGIAFAYYLVFPIIFQFFATVAPDGVTMMTDINRYLDFILKMFFAFGIAFEIPIATMLLLATGLATRASLGKARPYIIVGCFVSAMLITPPDVISQLLLAIPAWMLFEVGLQCGRFVERKPQEADPFERDPNID